MSYKSIDYKFKVIVTYTDFEIRKNNMNNAYAYP